MKFIFKSTTKSKIKRPGARGGKYWIDKRGDVQYGERPNERQAKAQNNKVAAKRQALDPSEYKKHGIPEDAKHAYTYDKHEKYTHEWRDSKGRLQRRYQQKFVDQKQGEKYKRITNAIHRLPELREAVNNDINGKDQLKRFTALAVRIIDITGGRVGNEKYTESNETHGITTLDKSHVIFNKNSVTLNYVGKKSVGQSHEITDPVVVEALRELRQLPGKRLFEIDNKGNINSEGVNKYLSDYGLTAKDLRTFRANSEFTAELMNAGKKIDDNERKKVVAQALKTVSDVLGNTPNVCRTNYISPELLNGYLQGKLSRKFALAKSFDAKEFDELFDEDELNFIDIWSSLTPEDEKGKRIETAKDKIEKSHVKAHTRITATGKIANVRDYENAKTKSDMYKPIAQRLVNAENIFVELVKEQFGFTNKEAEIILERYKKEKIVKLDPVMGQFILKHGVFWEKAPMQRALEQAQESKDKQPWEMTREEYASLYKTDLARDTFAKNQRKNEVYEAYMQGKTIPQYVLKDYPNIEEETNKIKRNVKNAELNQKSRETKKIEIIKREERIKEDEFKTREQKAFEYRTNTPLKQLINNCGYKTNRQGIHDLVKYDQEQSIKQALLEGKIVPPEVLKDYPDLINKYGKKITKSIRYIFKSHVTSHTRATKTGKIVNVRDYENKKQIKENLINRFTKQSFENVKHQMNEARFKQLGKEKQQEVIDNAKTRFKNEAIDFIENINKKDCDKIFSGILHPMNKKYRAWFKELTEIKLPSSLKETEQSLIKYVGADKYAQYLENKKVKKEEQNNKFLLENAVNEVKKPNKIKYDGKIFSNTKEFIDYCLEKSNYKIEKTVSGKKPIYKIKFKNDEWMPISSKNERIYIDYIVENRKNSKIKKSLRFLFKSHVKAHTRVTATGKIANVRDYSNIKTKKTDGTIKNTDRLAETFAKDYLNYIKDSVANELKPLTPEQRKARIDDIMGFYRKLATDIIETVINKDCEKIFKGYFDTRNVKFREWFNKLTGIKLPDTQKETNDVLIKFVGEGRYKEYLKEKGIKTEQAKIASDIENAIDVLSDTRNRKIKYDGIVYDNSKEFIDACLKKSNYKVEKTKSGIKPVYHVVSKDSSYIPFAGKYERIYIDYVLSKKIKKSIRYLFKSHVTGHFRTTDTGKLFLVNPYENKVVKKPEETHTANVRNISLDMIIRDEEQPREQFDKQKLIELGESISKLGLMQPIGVRPLESGKHKIIFGERRWRASKLAGLPDIPAQIIDVKDKRELYAIQVAENLAREEMNPIETANAYKKLIDVDMSYEEIAGRVGVSPLTVQRKLSLTTLIPEIQNLVKTGDLAESHGILIGLAGLRGQFQFEVLKKITESKKKLSRDELDGIVSRYKQAQSQISIFGSPDTGNVITGVNQINNNKVEAVKRQIANLLGGVVKAAEKIIDNKNYKLAPAILKQQGKLGKTKEELKLLQTYLSTIVKELETADAFFHSGGTIDQYLSKQNVKKETRKKRRRVRKSLELFKSIVKQHTRSSKMGKIGVVQQYQNKRVKSSKYINAEEFEKELDECIRWYKSPYDLIPEFKQETNLSILQKGLKYLDQKKRDYLDSVKGGEKKDMSQIQRFNMLISELNHHIESIDTQQKLGTGVTRIEIDNLLENIKTKYPSDIVDNLFYKRLSNKQIDHLLSELTEKFTPFQRQKDFPSKAAFLRYERKDTLIRKLVARKTGKHPQWDTYEQQLKNIKQSISKSKSIRFLFKSVVKQHTRATKTGKIVPVKQYINIKTKQAETNREAIGKAKQDILRAKKLMINAPEKSDQISGTKTKSDYRKYINEVQAWIDSKIKSKNVPIATTSPVGKKPTVDVKAQRSKADAPDVSKQPWEMTREEFLPTYKAGEKTPLESIAETRRLNKIRVKNLEKLPDGTKIYVGKKDIIEKTSISGDVVYIDKNGRGLPPSYVAGLDVPLEKLHSKIVKQALSEGKIVPIRVLKDYPELKAEFEKKSQKQTKPVADAVFIGHQKRSDGSSFALFNVTKKGNELFGSTVSARKLRENGLKVPAEIKKSIRYLIKGKVFPVGHVSIRKDGTMWKKIKKTGKPEDWKEVTGSKTIKRPGIGDFGAKIGGARKDTADRGFTKNVNKKKDDSTSAWRSKYVILKKVDGSGWTVGRKGDKWGFTSRSGQVYATEKEAEKAIPLIAVAQSHRIFNDRENKNEYAILKKVTDRKFLKVVNKTFPSEEDAKKYMAIHAEEILNLKTSFGEEILPCPEIAVRKGAVRRQGNATPEMFMKTFHPRGIEFGNWNNQEERQQVLNHAYDGLLDLADVLGVTPKDLMLGGELAIAFGARGQGLSGAKAHYERDYGVINLTKMKGAGALAHEWFHSLDHYFARKDSKSSSDKIKNERGDLVYKISSTKMDFISHGESYKTKLKPEIVEAFKSLMNTMERKTEKYVEDRQKAELFVGKSREQLQTVIDEIRKNLKSDLTETYTWRNSTKGLLPASKEQLAEFDKLTKKLIKGDDLKTKYIMSENARSVYNPGRQSNDTVEAISNIYKNVRNRSGFDSQNRNGILDSLVASMNIYNARLTMVKDAEKSTEKVKTVPTSYAIEAKKMDQARVGDYWSEPHEMAARAFSAYMEDKIAKKGNQSDFIVYHAHGGIIIPMIDGFIAMPYPEGNERIAVNKEFDRLFKLIRDNKELRKSIFGEG